MRRLLAPLAVAAATLAGAPPAQADGGVGAWERCVRGAYVYLNYTDPDSVVTFTERTAACSQQLAKDMSDPQRIEALKDCLYVQLRKTVKDPEGWGPMFVTGEAWRCVVIEYVGRDVKIPPDPAVPGA